MCVIVLSYMIDLRASSQRMIVTAEADGAVSIGVVVVTVMAVLTSLVFALDARHIYSDLKQMKRNLRDAWLTLTEKPKHVEMRLNQQLINDYEHGSRLSRSRSDLSRSTFSNSSSINDDELISVDSQDLQTDIEIIELG